MKHEGTNETTPLHIWKHEVLLEARRLAPNAADEAFSAAWESKGVKWYRAGEPVWMAADGLAFLATRAPVEIRADEESLRLGHMIGGALVRVVSGS